MTPHEIDGYLRGLQERIVSALEKIERGAGGKPFLRDAWQKEPGAKLGGEGVTMVLEGGTVFERAGVMFSNVRGDALPPSATSLRPQLAGQPFSAMGVSLVIHPLNPHVPTSHMNVRALSTKSASGESTGWFGGGFDLTPYYPVDDDVRHWHACARRAAGGRYAEWKARCDEYFFLKHRNETRGVGGIFFDDVDAGAGGFDVIKAVGDMFVEAYVPIVERNMTRAYGERERAWQLYRRGRYVEFNLVFDRGTHFGLQSGGRTESILASMPPLATWRYDYRPEPGSPEAALLDYLKPRDWLA